MIHFQYTFFKNIKKNETDMIAVYGKPHSSDIQTTYEYIQVTYGSHMSTDE